MTALLRLTPWLGLAAVLIGGGWWMRSVQAERDTLAAQVEGLRASVAAWDAAYADAEADQAAVVEALSRAHAQTARLIETRAATLEALRHAQDPDGRLDDPLPPAAAALVRRLYAHPDGAD
ncbi:hypothetical protein F1188_02675 [Roseospira marina]|uniref:Uncharacterized protein n=1 Tax=Roseospira marina TaxID=140057 RepID=A0A5M6IFD1_9PROT|nr:hypothetical protein [Roseospira marina]KAA5606842.1 hypothetical protein F1188_02675 [Roseospira marina]MBB4312996.1 hypothetical protein [Roseospira marina]MBB5086231.1 hypothetical protein [Roseospira marina]